MASFFAELKRRNVYKVAIAYAVVAWFLVQAASILFPTYEAPIWVMKVFIAVVAAGFPIALIIAWAFELTPEGLKRTGEVAPNESLPWSRRNFVAVVLALALAASGLLLFKNFRQPAALPAPALDEKSIAVLPFASLSEDKANAYFADGIQDEILTRLSKIGALKVISRTSTQQYQSAPGNLAEIAKKLGVAHILEGSVQKAGESVRVNVQLIKAKTDSHLWAETYDRKLTDIFAVESEVAQRIADSLEAKLSGGEKAAINYVGTKNPEAYDAFLRAIALRNSQSRTDQEQTIRFLRQSVALDPDYAEAWSNLAFAEGLKFIEGENTDAQRALVEEAAEKAAQLDPNHGGGHAAKGIYFYYCLQEYDRALAELERARQQAPNDPLIIQALGLVKRRQGKLEESLALQMQSARIDPLNQDIWTNIAGTYRGMRQFGDALAMFDRARAIAPNEPAIVLRRAEAELAGSGDLAKAARIYAEAQPPFGSPAYDGLIVVLSFQRRFEEAIAKLTGDVERAEANKGSPLSIARAHLAIAELQIAAGDAATAQPILRKAADELAAVKAQGNNGPALRAYSLVAQAWLGQEKEVAREAAEHIAQQKKDRWTGPLAEEDAARAYLILGDHERALSTLEPLLKQSYADSITPALLRLDPIYDAVRGNPRFQKLSGGKP